VTFGGQYETQEARQIAVSSAFCAVLVLPAIEEMFMHRLLAGKKIRHMF
jgi:hypothetical protein